MYANIFIYSFLLNVFFLFGFLTSSSATRLYRLPILRAATHEKEREDHDICLSRSHYIFRMPQLINAKHAHYHLNSLNDGCHEGTAFKKNFVLFFSPHIVRSMDKAANDNKSDQCNPNSDKFQGHQSVYKASSSRDAVFRLLGVFHDFLYGVSSSREQPHQLI